MYHTPPSFDYKKLEILLQHFYKISNVRYSLMGTDSTVICHAQNMTAFCDRIARAPKGHVRCTECDFQATRHLSATGQSHYTYRCHAGLTETLIPIRMEDRLLGYMCLGQYLDGDSMEDAWQVTHDLLSQWHPDPDSFYDDFHALTVLDRPTILSSIAILTACSLYICSECLVNTSNPSDLQRLERYIDQHYSQRLSLAVIAKALGMSKTKLCALGTQENTTVHHMIRDRRLAEARRLLRETDMAIARVADYVGISDYNYFSKVFRAQQQCTPKQYRAKMTGQG